MSKLKGILVNDQGAITSVKRIGNVTKLPTPVPVKEIKVVEASISSVVVTEVVEVEEVIEPPKNKKKKKNS